MTYFAHKPSTPSTGPAAAWLVGLIALLAVPSTALGQSVEYSPSQASQYIQRVEVFVGGEQVNQNDPDERKKYVGPVGVERCKELTNNAPNRPVEFNFVYASSGQNAPRLIDEDDHYLIDSPFFRQDSIECSPGGGAGGSDSIADCEPIISNPDEIIIESSSNGERVTVQWGELREEADGTIGDTETCEFPDDPSRGNGGGDMGDAGMGDDAGMDSGMDTGSDAQMDVEAGPEVEVGPEVGDAEDAGEDNGGGASAPDVSSPKTHDHIYAIRLFLTSQNNTSTDNYRVGDAALRLDRTRPAGPVNAFAASTESVLKVRFNTPSVREEIESYHVFYSDSPLPSFQQASPEDLIDNPAVTRRLLRGDADEISGQITEDIRGIDRTQGDSLYVGVASRDEARNYSPLAIIGPVEVQKSIDFWERYLSDGGLEEGGFGCHAVAGSPVGPSILLVLFGFVGLRLRRQ
jgi:hypothetical protein